MELTQHHATTGCRVEAVSLPQDALSISEFFELTFQMSQGDLSSVRIVFFWLSDSPKEINRQARSHVSEMQILDFLDTEGR